jgi:hypothetical protein
VNEHASFLLNDSTSSIARGSARPVCVDAEVGVCRAVRVS